MGVNFMRTFSSEGSLHSDPRFDALVAKARETISTRKK